MSRVIAAALKQYSTIDTRDYAALLHLAGEYAIMELEVHLMGGSPTSQMKNTRLSDESILVLGISKPDGSYLGAPRGQTALCPKDILILYGRSSALVQLGSRRAGIEGDIMHRAEILEEKRIGHDQGP